MNGKRIFDQWFLTAVYLTSFPREREKVFNGARYLKRDMYAWWNNSKILGKQTLF